MVLPHIYRSAFSFKDGLALVVRYKDGKKGYINRQGDFEIALNSKSTSFAEGMASVLDSLNKSKYGFINIQNELVFPMIYNHWWPFGMNLSFFNGMYQTRISAKYGFIDEEGVLAVDTYSSVGDFSEGLAAVGAPKDGERRGIYGFIDKTGSLVIPHQYRSIFSSTPKFHNGLCLVTVEEKSKDFWTSNAGYINKKGEWVYGPVKANWSFHDYVIE